MVLSGDLSLALLPDPAVVARLHSATANGRMMPLRTSFQIKVSFSITRGSVKELA